MKKLSLFKTRFLVGIAAMVSLAAQAQITNTIVQWSFQNLPITNYCPNPTPSVDGSAGSVLALTIGMATSYPAPPVGTNDPDIVQGAGSDSYAPGAPGTGSDGITNLLQEWRIRAQGPGTGVNGWSSYAPVGSQGIQLNVDTTGFTNPAIAFSWYLTKAGEANLQLEYTIDGITWSNAPITVPTAQAGYLILSNNTAATDPDSIAGYYVHSVGYTKGEQWYTNLTATITNSGAANNPSFALRIVNASTGPSCIDGTGGALNNSSGNWRFGNITVVGTTLPGIQTPPVITPAASATVDADFVVTFPSNPGWSGAVNGIKVNGTTLSPSAYLATANSIIFAPGASTLLQTPGQLSIAISAPGYGDDVVQQNIAAGAATQFVITSQPTAPTGNGGTLVTQPALAFLDQYRNVTTNVVATPTAAVTASPNGAWFFGSGSGVTQPITNGMVIFTNLSAISSAAVTGASINFTWTGLSNFSYSSTNTGSFNIPAPASSGFTPGNLVVEQQDLATKNSTFSMIELSPTIPNQTTPVNIFPVPATGPSALRQTSSGSAGSLADSDDGTLLCFSAAQCGDSSVSDVTSINPRGAGTFDSQANYVLQTTYQGDGADTDQARSAVTVDDVNFFMGDKGGVFVNDETTNDAYILYTSGPLGNPANVRSLKSFGGTVYALQQEGSTDPNATVLAIVPAPAGSPDPTIPGAPAPGNGYLFPLEGFNTNGNVLDFYMLRSGNNGNVYDVAYYIEGDSTTSGAIYKYYYTGNVDGTTSEQVWVPAGSAPVTQAIPAPPQQPTYTANGGDGLCAVTNVNGGVDLYYTTGKGGSVSNSVVMVHDSSIWNAAINLTATNVLYTTSTNSSLRGIAFAPVGAGTGPTFSPITPIRINTSGTHIVGSGASAYLQFGFSNAPGGGPEFTVWGTTNLSLPFSQWLNLGHPIETASGIYQFKDAAVTSVPTRFYQITSP